MDARTIADKYITRDGRKPRPAEPSKVVWAPVKIQIKEYAWLNKAVLRNGYMPTRDRDGDSAPHLSEMRAMHHRGLVQGMPWRITKFGRDCVREFELASATTQSTPEPRSSNLHVPAGTPAAIRTLEEIEREAIYSALAHFSGNKSRAARALGIAVRTIRNKLQAYEQSARGEERP